MPPESLPVLARGKHRSPRRGACFMEFASLLAGERWSDHPKCTHPVLAALARCVNDCTTDAGRPLLAPLIPDVIGTDLDDPRVAPELVVLACRTALPYARGHSRFVVAVALLSAERQLAENGHAVADRAGLAEDDPLTGNERATAEAYVDRFRVSPRFYRRKGALGVVQYAVASMAGERGQVTDGALRDLLTRSIARYHEIVPAARTSVPGDRWDEACLVVGVTSDIPR